jgi:protein phosphatase
MSLSFCAASHAGVRRSSNEDSYLARPDLGLFAVADGVGGHAAGEVASRAVLDAIEEAVADTRGRTADGPWPFEYQPPLGVDGNRLNWALYQANLRVRREALAAPGRGGMATTVAAILVENDAGGPREPARSATVAHVGDSRIYRWRRGQIDRLTRDHSWVQDQVSAGLITEGEARRHPRRNLLTRAVSGAGEPAVEIGWVPLAPGDRLVLCTDGLSGVIPDQEIARITGEDFDAASGSTACDALVQAANLAGGPDNVTVIVVRL